MSRRLAACLAVAGALGCSNGGSDGTGPASCGVIDLCARFPASRVTSACGGSASSSTYDSTVNAGGAAEICTYTGAAATVFEMTRACFTEPSDALLVYNADHDVPLPVDFVREDLTGLGDAAFFRSSAQLMRGQVYVVRSNLYLSLLSYEAPDAAAAKTCLTALAGDLLVVR